MKSVFLLIYLIEKFLGIEFKKDNLNLKPKNLISVGIILGITVLIVGYSPLLSVLDDMITSLNPDWIHHQALSSFKLSFLTTPIHLALVCLFKDVRNPILKFKNTFALLFVGFIGVYIMIYLMDLLPHTIPEITLGIMWLFPLLTVIIVRLSITQEIRR